MTEKYHPQNTIQPINFNASDFGSDFVWGTAASAFQTEGGNLIEGRSPSIWDSFMNRIGTIRNHDKADSATEFYTRYPNDLDLIRDLNFKAFRFSLSWSRILPDGTGKPNVKGIDFYNRVIDACHERGLEPWLTIYHWDLPQVLEDKGGWKTRDIVSWFSDYVRLVLESFGDRVNNWVVMNEPETYTALGYLKGDHAPGKRGLKNFLPSIHHACLSQAAGGIEIRSYNPLANIGTTFSVSSILPAGNTEEDCIAACRLDALQNRLFIEPTLGLGYPISDLPILKRMEKYIIADDESKLKFDFDFIGLQYYFRAMAAHSHFSQNHIKKVPAQKRNVALSSMGYEMYPQGLFSVLKKFNDYNGIKKLILTEVGVCVEDKLLEGGKIRDVGRINYYSKLLESALLAKQIGVPLAGIFAWSPTDNFEWSKGYSVRFGLTYVDFKNQKRYIKDSGYWFKEFLK